MILHCAACSNADECKPTGELTRIDVRVDYAVGALATADFDQDGHADLVAALLSGQARTVGVLLGNGDGTFRPLQQYDAKGLVREIVVSDLDGDHVPDIVATTNVLGAGVAILLGRGDGTFEPAVLTTGAPSSTATAIAIDDLDRDGVPDLAIGFTIDFNTNDPNSTDRVRVMLGNGDGTFATGIDVVIGSQRPAGIAIGDLDHDGSRDLVVVSRRGTIDVYIGNGDGSLRPPFGFPAGAPWWVALRDLNHDGSLDAIAAGGDAFKVLRGHDGEFLDANPQYPTATALLMTVLDIDGDRNEDFVSVDRGNATLDVILGNGDATFGAKVSRPTVQEPLRVTSADFNGDRAPDLVVASAFNAIALHMGSCTP